MHAGIRSASAEHPYLDRSASTERVALAVAVVLALCIALAVAVVVGGVTLAVFS